jgi:hypothetical protein
MRATIFFATASYCLASVAGLVIDQARLSPYQHGDVEGTSRLRRGIVSPLQRATRSPDASGFVALGDSYSAGIGTGINGTEDACRRGLHAHPRLIADDLDAQLGNPNTTTAFQFLSCTGSATSDVLTGTEMSQIDALNTSQPIDFALLSLGGNDLGFFDVINSCIFRFYSFYSGTCEQALNATQVAIESSEFEERFRVVVAELLDTVRWEKKPWFSVTVTGYARFFNAETDACNDMSLGVWWNGPQLAADVRVRMNALVDAVNDKLARAVDAINAQFVADKLLFINFDDVFEGHRFCEPDVLEPDYGRDDTWFFLVGGPDNAGDENDGGNGDGDGDDEDGTPPLLPSRRSPQDLTPPSPRHRPRAPPDSVPVDPSTCLEPALRSGDWGALALCYMARAKSRDPSLRLATHHSPPHRRDVKEDDHDDEMALTPDNSMWYVPTYYGKVFHPRSRAQEAIRDRIMGEWRRLLDDDDDDHDDGGVDGGDEDKNDDESQEL